jgi:hypothetical protein
VFKLYDVLKILPCYVEGLEPEPEPPEPEPHQNFHSEPEPEPHKNYAAPQHWLKCILQKYKFRQM